MLDAGGGLSQQRGQEARIKAAALAAESWLCSANIHTTAGDRWDGGDGGLVVAGGWGCFGQPQSRPLAALGPSVGEGGRTSIQESFPASLLNVCAR